MVGDKEDLGDEVHEEDLVGGVGGGHVLDELFQHREEEIHNLVDGLPILIDFKLVGAK